MTGGSGFLGGAVVRQLAHLGCDDPFVPRSKAYDLRTDVGVRRFLPAGMAGFAHYILQKIDPQKAGQFFARIGTQVHMFTRRNRALVAGAVDVDWKS